jgi:hypothetical protein
MFYLQIKTYTKSPYIRIPALNRFSTRGIIALSNKLYFCPVLKEETGPS